MKDLILKTAVCLVVLFLFVALALHWLHQEIVEVSPKPLPNPSQIDNAVRYFNKPPEPNLEPEKKQEETKNLPEHATKQIRTIGEITFADASRVQLLVQVYEEDLALFKEGQQVTLELPTFDCDSIRALVECVLPKSNSHSRSGHARLLFDNPGLTLGVGNCVVARVEVIP